MKSRFYSPSSGLDLSAFFRRYRTVLWACATVAACLHLAAARVAIQAQEQQAPKPLTTQFVKRQPRLTKPLELKKRPRPKRRSMRRQMVTVHARVDRQEATKGIGSPASVQSLVRPKTMIGRLSPLAQADMEPGVAAQAVASTKEVEKAVNMSLEMVDIEALDTGQYHAMVVQDPNDKRSIRDFFLVDMAGNVCEWCNDFCSADYYSNSPSENPEGPGRSDFPRSEWNAVPPKVIRGGGYNASATEMQCANRNKLSGTDKVSHVGFRIAPDL